MMPRKIVSRNPNVQYAKYSVHKYCNFKMGTKFLDLQSAGHRFFAAMCPIFSTGALKKKARTNVKNPAVQRAQTPISISDTS